MRTMSIRLALALLLAGCGGGETASEEAGDGADDAALGVGKADAAWSDCELAEAVKFANDPSTSLEVLSAAGVHTRARKGIVAHRDGADGQPGTADDDRFDSASELDDVRYVGPVAFAALVAAVTDRCAGAGQGSVEVVFSPQPYESSHLAKVAAAIEGAQRSLDIAMYSFRDSGIRDAVLRAVERGVSARLLFESANDHRKDPAGTLSEKLELAGIDVRWINKIMHHKFVLVDGPRTSVAEASEGLLSTGSANWSSSAGTRFDENTVIVQGNAELMLRFQREFNFLWANSRDFVAEPTVDFFTSMEIGEELIVDDPAVDVLFTSDNFDVKWSSRYGATFSVRPESDAVADGLVALIAGAQSSIHVASGHLRSRPVAEALLARHAADPDLDIRVYLDGQEYLGSYSHRLQEEDLGDCLVEAGESESKQRKCRDSGFLFSYALHEAGIQVRYKYYAYRWNYTYAPQMPHKYMIIDGRILVQGSYNLSDNAEHNTMENVVVYDGAGFPDVVSAFEANFEALWETERAGGRYEALLEAVESGDGPIPLVFDPLALSWDQIDRLKRAIRAACPDVDSEDFRRNAGSHRECERPEGSSH